MSAALEDLTPCIRPMHRDDVVQVAAIERASYEFPWSAGIFSDCLRVGYVCRVLEQHAMPIGYGVLSAAAREAHLLNLCLHPDWRGLGLGRRLLDVLLEESVGAGARRLFLEVRPSNEPARGLYLSAGFRVIGRRRGYYQAREGREDALVLTLDLPPLARR